MIRGGQTTQPLQQGRWKVNASPEIQELGHFIEAVHHESVRPGAYGIAEAIVRVHNAIVAHSPTSASDVTLREQLPSIAARAKNAQKTELARNNLDVDTVWKLTPWAIREANKRLKDYIDLDEIRTANHSDPGQVHTRANRELEVLATQNRAGFWDMLSGMRAQRKTKAYLTSILFETSD